jgi:hypothetical protein
MSGRSICTDLRDPIYIEPDEGVVRHGESGLVEPVTVRDIIAAPAGRQYDLGAIKRLRWRVAQFYELGPEYVDPPVKVPL